MHVIVFAARKGGASKTTLCAHLAVEASRTGTGLVLMTDMDPQQSLAAWWSDRGAEWPRLVGMDMTQLDAQVAKAKAHAGLLFIDTPPHDSSIMEKVFAVADLVLIPVKPSPHDLKAVGVTVKAVKAAGRPFVFIVTQAVARASITTQAVLALSQHGPVATTIMTYRVDYCGSMTDGRTVQEVAPKGKAAGEIRELWSYVYQHLNNCSL